MLSLTKIRQVTLKINDEKKKGGGLEEGERFARLIDSFKLFNNLTNFFALYSNITRNSGQVNTMSFWRKAMTRSTLKKALNNLRQRLRVWI